MGLTFKLKEANRQRHQNHTDVERHRGEQREIQGANKRRKLLVKRKRKGYNKNTIINIQLIYNTNKEEESQRN